MKRCYPNRTIDHPLYTTWQAMRRRCNWSGNDAYHNYGGRGIKVCERWNNFRVFVADMGPKPTLEHTLERIDNDGHYEPSNCRWATRLEQGQNTRRCRFVTIDGITASIGSHARRLGMDRSTVGRKYLGEVPRPRIRDRTNAAIAARKAARNSDERKQARQENRS